MNNLNENELVQQYKGKITQIATAFVRKYNVRSFEVADIEQELFATLIRAIRKYNPEKHKNTQFNTFFIRSVRSQLADLQKYCGTRYKLHNYAQIEEVIKIQEETYKKVSRDLAIRAPKKTYSNEQKINAVKEYIKGASINEVAKKYATNASNIRLWRKQLQERYRELYGEKEEV